MLSNFSSWTTTISLIFGGCCSTAITLEQITSEHPDVGSILTFFQFLVISLHGLPKFLIWTRFGPRFRPRRVPFATYLAQVVLFYLVSLLNNAAFAYRIPMAVHIIFRSAGLVISMVLGWLISDKRYSTTQIVSVLLVTFGVVITTLSAQSSSSKATTSSTTTTDHYTYAKGIAILTLALVFSGFLGLLQDWAHSTRRKLQSSQSEQEGPAPWQESMFYLHILALPMFLPLLPDLAAQMHALNRKSPKAEFHVPIPLQMASNYTWENIVPPHFIPDFPIRLLPYSQGSSFLSVTRTLDEDAKYPLTLSMSIPHVYLPLILNTVTQLLCVAGVNRLTTRVSALTVTLVLVVRKATSLIISVVGVAQTARAIRDFIFLCMENIFSTFGWNVQWIPRDGWGALRVAGLDIDGMFRILFEGHKSTTRSPPSVVNKTMMWTGAAMVMLGTVGYTIGSRRKSKSKDKTD